MRCPMKMLILIFVTLSLSSCVTTGNPPTDSFCQIYNQIVIAKGDGAIKASAGVKRRILANELMYRSQCGVR